MAKWRGVSWKTIEGEINELEALGYLVRPGRDSKHGGSYFFDLTGLLSRLGRLAYAEEKADELRKAQGRVLEGALSDPSTDEETNRELKQKTEAENDGENGNIEIEKATETGDHSKRPVVEDTNSVRVQSLEVEDGRSNPIETKPVSKLMKYVLPSNGPRR
jgi:hypothetical protein